MNLHRNKNNFWLAIQEETEILPHAVNTSTSVSLLENTIFTSFWGSTLLLRKMFASYTSPTFEIMRAVFLHICSIYTQIYAQIFIYSCMHVTIWQQNFWKDIICQAAAGRDKELQNLSPIKVKLWALEKPRLSLWPPNSSKTLVKIIASDCVISAQLSTVVIRLYQTPISYFHTIKAYVTISHLKKKKKRILVPVFHLQSYFPTVLYLTWTLNSH